jgi:Glycoside hydrolase family 44
VDTSRFKQNRPSGPLTTVPSTTDGYVYQNQFVDWMAHAVPGAKVLYSLDNEPNDWYQTHPEVHPKHLTYAELTNDHIRFAAMIKNTYAALGKPAPLVTAPALDGWQGQEDPDNNDGSSADYQTYGRFVDYWLKRMKSADASAGHRIVDVLDLHWYPQVVPDVYNLTHTSSVVATREQAPRSLWDATYKENSWITNDVLLAPIKLIPRVKAEIAQYDPGIGLGISEWNYGGGQDISGGVTDADTLGIFGKYGLKTATYWPDFEPHEDWAFGAFQVFRNYDGHGAAFGDTSVSATDSDTAYTSVYASEDSKNANRMVIVAINKNTAATSTSIKVSNFAAVGHAAVYRLTSASPHPLAAGTITATGANTFSYTMPAQSVSVLVPGP